MSKLNFLKRKEDDIQMTVSDPRYRYYVWLRSWLGMESKYETHKCPFYQFMLWGSIIMVLTFPMFIIFKILDTIIFNPISILIGKNNGFRVFLKLGGPVMTSVLTVLALSWIVGAIGFLISNPITFSYLGLGIHYIFATPYLIGSGVYAVFAFLFSKIVALFLWINWSGVGFWTGYVLTWLAVLVIVAWVLYRFILFAANTKVFKSFINWSCTIREQRANKQIQYIKQESVHKQREPSKLGIFLLEQVFKPIGKGFVWTIIYITNIVIAIVKSIKNVFVVIWSFTSETFSNHCPPIEFIEHIHDVEVIHYSSNYAQYGFMTSSDTEYRKKYFNFNIKDKNYLIDENLLSKKDKEYVIFHKNCKVIISGTIKLSDRRIIQTLTKFEIIKKQKKTNK